MFVHNRPYPSRHYVALSLVEAEAVRSILHLKQDQTAPTLIPEAVVADGEQAPQTSVALRTIDTMLDCSDDFHSAEDYQHATTMQLWRFIDSEVDYEEKGLNLLLRALQSNVCEEREKWFLDVRDCRRRKQVAIARTPLARLFTTPDE
jgi:hypothetical protein